MDQRLPASHRHRLRATSASSEQGLAIAVSVRGGRIQQLVADSKTYPDRLFFLGGVDSLRGFLQDSLVPEDIAAEILCTSNANKPDAEQLTIDKVAIRGGDVFINPRAELRIPFGGIWEGGALSRYGQCLGRAEELRPFRAPLRRRRRHSHRHAHWPHRFRLWHQLDSQAVGRPRQLPLLDWALLTFPVVFAAARSATKSKCLLRATPIDCPGGRDAPPGLGDHLAAICLRLLEQPGACPLHGESAGGVRLSAADLRGDSLVTSSLLQKKNQLRRPGDPLPPKIDPAVRFEQRGRGRQIGVLVETLADDVEHAAAPFEVHRKLARQEVSLRGDIRDRERTLSQRPP